MQLGTEMILEAHLQMPVRLTLWAVAIRVCEVIKLHLNGSYALRAR